MAEPATEETTLAVLVPEAEALVHPYRIERDPSAAEGMPAHVTILYPFKQISDISDQDLHDLRRLFAAHMAFEFSLTGIGDFESTCAYLAPEPSAPFYALTDDVVSHYPDYPPYRGMYPDNAPHLTVADISDRAVFDRVMSQFRADAPKYLPIAATATKVSLMQRRGGRWQRRIDFDLAERTS